MNEKTEQLLQTLADKLGTTTEYLWTILVNQAKYDVIVSLIQMAFMAAFIIATIKIHFKLLKTMPNSDYSYYEEYEPGAVIGIVLAGIMCMILFVCFLSGFNDLVAAIFNPEYWALRQLLHKF